MRTVLLLGAVTCSPPVARGRPAIQATARPGAASATPVTRSSRIRRAAPGPPPASRATPPWSDAHPRPGPARPTSPSAWTMNAPPRRRAAAEGLARPRLTPGRATIPRLQVTSAPRRASSCWSSLRTPGCLRSTGGAAAHTATPLASAAQRRGERGQSSARSCCRGRGEVVGRWPGARRRSERRHHPAAMVEPREGNEAGELKRSGRPRRQDRPLECDALCKFIHFLVQAKSREANTELKVTGP